MKITKTNRFALITLLALVGSVSAFADATFAPTGVIDMLPTSMSDDASIVVGTGLFQVPNLYYTETSGASIIGDGCFNGLPAISGDGTTVLGCHVNAQGNENAAKWLGGTSWQDLGSERGAVPCDTSLSGAYGVNQDGSLGVGLLWRPQVCHANAGYWDLINGGPASVIPTVFDGPASRANAVNASGNVIVGWRDQPTGERTAAKWVHSSSGYLEELILTSSGGFNGEAMAVSADGKTIVGGAYDFGNSAWMWRPKTGVQPIEVAGGGDNAMSTALDVSDNGEIVVGFSRTGRHTHAFIWINGNGGIFLDEYLANQGVVVPVGWSLTVASLISADGNTIYGWGVNPDRLIEMHKVTLNTSAK
jgi:probable HAF family extracellular repeat protein